MKKRTTSLLFVIFHFFAISILVWLSQQGIMFSWLLPIDYHLPCVILISLCLIGLDALYSYLAMHDSQNSLGWEKALFIADIAAVTLASFDYVMISLYILISDVSMMLEDFNLPWAVITPLVILSFALYRFKFFKTDQQS